MPQWIVYTGREGCESMTDNTISRVCQCPSCGGRQRTRAVTRLKCVYCGRSYLVRHSGHHAAQVRILRAIISGQAYRDQPGARYPAGREG